MRQVRIHLYPVEATSSDHALDSRPRRSLRRATQLQLDARRASSANPVGSGALGGGLAAEARPQCSFKTAPSGITPCSTKRQRAMTSFRAKATIPTLRPRAPRSEKL